MIIAVADENTDSCCSRQMLRTVSCLLHRQLFSGVLSFTVYHLRQKLEPTFSLPLGLLLQKVSVSIGFLVGFQFHHISFLVLFRFIQVSLEEEKC